MQWNPTLIYDHLLIATTFLYPERIESPVISFILQARYVNRLTTPLLRPHDHGAKVVVLS